jgi:hypothetical protein
MRSATAWRSSTSTSTNSIALFDRTAGCGRTDRRNLAEFRRGDYLGPIDLPLAEAVRLRVEHATQTPPCRARFAC